MDRAHLLLIELQQVGVVRFTLTDAGTLGNMYSVMCHVASANFEAMSYTNFKVKMYN